MEYRHLPLTRLVRTGIARALPDARGAQTHCPEGEHGLQEILMPLNVADSEQLPEQPEMQSQLTGPVPHVLSTHRVTGQPLAM